MSWTEWLGFITGGLSVWLTVREHVWLWPVGVANNIFFFILFWNGRLYADASLQLVYLALSAYGWWNWLRGGADSSVLTITRTPWKQWIAMCAIAVAATWGMREVLISVHDAAPFWDALTTVLSLVAQYMLCRKQLEHWFIWIAADVIYVPLYIVRALPLTGFLYGVFLLMCFAGLREWLTRWKSALAS